MMLKKKKKKKKKKEREGGREREIHAIAKLAIHAFH